MTPSFRVTPERDAPPDGTPDRSAQDPEPGHLTLGEWQVAPDQPEEDSPASMEDADASDMADCDAFRFEDVRDEPLSTASPGDFEAAHAGDASLTKERQETGADDAQLKQWLTSADLHDAAADDRRHDDEDLEDLDGAGFVDDEATSAGDGVVSDAEGGDAPEAGPSALEARIAEVEAAVAAREDQWEPDGSSDDAYSGGKTEPLPWEDHVDTVAPRQGDEMGEDMEHEDMSFPDKADAPERLDDRREAAGASGETGPSETKTETESVGKADEAGDDAWYREDADTILDEEALRDLVSEIVRQELQGTLGERITRNVRKLVRREIHRAMMGQDLD
ncbi:MAG: hypothetical protein ACE369_07105 [Roseovarius sp.]